MILNNIVFLRGTEMNKMYLDTREEVWSFGDGMVGCPSCPILLDVLMSY